MLMMALIAEQASVTDASANACALIRPIDQQR
jgi:hypothetical protein